MSEVEIGKAKFGGEGRIERKYLKIKEGDNVFRLLPPIGSLAKEGKWAVYAGIHYGIRRQDKKMMLVYCPEKRDPKTKMVTVRCALCDKIAEKRHAVEERKKKLEAEGFDQDVIRVKLKSDNDWLKENNLARKWHVNAMDTAGVIGKLEFAHAYYKDLELLIKELTRPESKTRKPIDPFDPETGILFNFFYKEGNTKTRIQKVSIKKISKTLDTPEGPQTFDVNASRPLTPDELERYKREYVDLTKLARVVTPQEMARIVNSGFDPDVVEAIYAQPKFTEEKKTTVAEDAGGDDDEIPENTSATVPTVQVADSVPAQLKEQLKVTPPPSTSTAPSTKAPAKTTLSESDIDALFNQ